MFYITNKTSEVQQIHIHEFQPNETKLGDCDMYVDDIVKAIASGVLELTTPCGGGLSIVRQIDWLRTCTSYTQTLPPTT